MDLPAVISLPDKSQASHHEDEVMGGAHCANPMKDTNPKTIHGQSKPQMGLVPGAALVEFSEALRHGTEKYGPANWRVDPVSASTYYHAAIRHLNEWWDGLNKDSGSGASPLGHVGANMAIIIDAAASGTLIDDRPPCGRTHAVIAERTRPISAGGSING